MTHGEQSFGSDCSCSSTMSTAVRFDPRRNQSGSFQRLPPQQLRDPTGKTFQSSKQRGEITMS